MTKYIITTEGTYIEQEPVTDSRDRQEFEAVYGSMQDMYLKVVTLASRLLTNEEYYKIRRGLEKDLNAPRGWMDAPSQEFVITQMKLDLAVIAAYLPVIAVKLEERGQ